MYAVFKALVLSYSASPEVVIKKKKISKKSKGKKRALLRGYPREQPRS